MNQHISAFSLLVRDYDEAIRYFTGKLDFALLEDTDLGGGKRWVRVAPKGTHGTCLLLAKAVTPRQVESIGCQAGGRVFLFLHSDDFWRDYREMNERGVRFLERPRRESYGMVALFEDLSGNRWDLVEPLAPVSDAEFPGEALWDLQVPEKERIDRLVSWGQAQPLVRAMILTSTRSIPNISVDILSDYDVILYVRDVLPFYETRSWLAAFGEVLALYRDPLETGEGFLKAGYVIQFQGGLKIDFTIWQAESLEKIVTDGHLPTELDAGYRVLLDKDRLTEGLKSPTYQAYIPKPPTLVEYKESLEGFFLDATYVARYLWRGDPLAARTILEQFMKGEHLLPVLEWLIEIEHGWTVKPGPYGRGLQKWLHPDLWRELEDTCPSAGKEEIWQALFQTLDLMRKAAKEVGEHFGYTYPEEQERMTRAYILGIKKLEHGKI
jgi:aminoglycoside 6-adenylyltransferase